MTEHLSRSNEGVEEVHDQEDFIAESFTLSASMLVAIKRLGYEDIACELMPLVKTLSGELVMRLSTGVYVNGLAYELSVHGRKLWDLEYSDSELIKVLTDALDIRRRLDEGGVSKEEARELLNRFTRLIGVDVGKTQVIRGIVNNPEPALVLQLIATALAVCTGGLSGS